MLKILQYENANVTPREDAYLYDYLLNHEFGVIEGFECRLVSGSNVSISDGTAMLKGRMVTTTGSYIDAELYNSVSVGIGVIYLEIDTTLDVSNAVKIKSKV